ncbi:kinetochore protein spc7-like [Dorcoceras hygrometricum]|uniref:Kinetochore protein spc7-like n=1 Tax=Dorcoceras hygrometricum TaxID=472368 RepID=A0A2Z7CTI7_9LAMI|nr:kinetochore protein spc7-like [Dorcoceras hygrometricum]
MAKITDSLHRKDRGSLTDVDGGKTPVVKEVTSWEGNQLGNKLRAQQCLSVMNKPARCKETSWLRSNEPEPNKKSSGQEQERTDQEQLYTRENDKSKLEIGSRAVANKSSRVEETTSSKERLAQCKPEQR